MSESDGPISPCPHGSVPSARWQVCRGVVYKSGSSEDQLDFDTFLYSSHQMDGGGAFLLLTERTEQINDGEL